MNKSLEVLYDSKPNEGCGCNCGCAGTTIVEEMVELVENLKRYNFESKLDIDLIPISDFESAVLISKMNTILDKTNAAFRVNEENMDEILSELLPITTLNGEILTAYGVPTLNEVVLQVQKNN